ncbi:rRNA pseudouridine synthase [Candidatus Saccharibacteria bacterium]|nr:rRNA pseudouridine synthase [Candidatus Saccharibacteria bacterium]
MAIRLNKFLAERLGLSRREADDFIASKKVSVNGEVAELGARISEDDKVVYNGQPVIFEKEYTYLKFNKPVGFVCSRKKQGDADTIYSLLPEKYRVLKTVGRLDKDSCGLILLTDDGDFAFKLTHPKFKKHKTYLVTLDRPLEPLHQQMISDFGVDLPDGKSRLILSHPSEDAFSLFPPETPRAELDSTNRMAWQVEMSEGRNRQIRRTFAALGYRVVFLKRTEFDDFSLGPLKEGEWEEIIL